MKQLNEQQQEAYNQILSFIESRTENQMFCLKGYAGTGKTFLISRVIETIERDHPRWKVAMTAPTNKAVQVLREASDVSNQVVFKTIHSLLGLQEVIRDSGEIDFEKDFNEDPSSFRNLKVLIVDEVSMLADKLFFEIKRYNNELKIIMMGDPAQIPPVGKEDCEPFLNPEEHGIIEYQLTKIMRQGEGSAIVDHSFKIRENLSEDGFDFEPGNDVKVFYSNVDRYRTMAEFERIFISQQASEGVKVIAWTNRKVNEYNGYIRKLMYGNNAPRFMKGERLVMNKPFVVDKDLHKDKCDMLTTNQEVEVIDFYTTVRELHDGISLEVYVAYVSYISRNGGPKSGSILIMHENSMRDFQHHLNEIKTKAITGPMHERRETWKQYYNLLRSVADVSYAYAITAHKSQGSTYHTAIVDVGNIELNPNVVERNRILYTSITRAKSELLIIQ